MTQLWSSSFEIWKHQSIIFTDSVVFLLLGSPGTAHGDRLLCRLGLLGSGSWQHVAWSHFLNKNIYIAAIHFDVIRENMGFIYSSVKKSSKLKRRETHWVTRSRRTWFYGWTHAEWWYLPFKADQMETYLPSELSLNPGALHRRRTNHFTPVPSWRFLLFGSVELRVWDPVVVLAQLVPLMSPSPSCPPVRDVSIRLAVIKPLVRWGVTRTQRTETDRLESQTACTFSCSGSSQSACWGLKVWIRANQLTLFCSGWY